MRYILTLLLFIATPVSASEVFPNPASGWWKQKTIQGYKRASTSRTCLTADTAAVLARLEATFGKVQIVSTCRPGATIRGTGRPSEHRFGRAVDFNPPKGKKREVVQWLHKNNRGLVMTYARMSHVHFDTGKYHRVARGGKKVRYTTRKKVPNVMEVSREFGSPS